ncbi:MAG: molybdopterin-dependent oxidoreductase, partial [Acidimicrobiia bacterium]|nr:molybdopterin-dependent oxidoreductase [Acidimicrobiia bacterium]
MILSALPNLPPVSPASNRRLEDDRFITGTARYVADLALSGDVPEPVLSAEFIRSPEAHARILSVETDAAAGAAGVVAAYAAGDLMVDDFPGSSLPVRCEGMDRPVLAHQVVRFAGEPVAMIVASEKALAVDAASSVWVDYQPLPVVVTIDDAVADEVVLHSRAGTNVADRWSFRTPGEPPPVEHEVTIEVVNGRLVPNPMEALAILAVPHGDRLIVYVSHQRPHELRTRLAEQLGMSLDHLRVIVPDVGGAFGMKGMEFPEYVAVAA